MSSPEFSAISSHFARNVIGNYRITDLGYPKRTVDRLFIDGPGVTKPDLLNALLAYESNDPSQLGGEFAVEKARIDIINNLFSLEDLIPAAQDVIGSEPFHADNKAGLRLIEAINRESLKHRPEHDRLIPDEPRINYLHTLQSFLQSERNLPQKSRVSLAEAVINMAKVVTRVSPNNRKLIAQADCLGVRECMYGLASSLQLVWKKADNLLTGLLDIDPNYTSEQVEAIFSELEKAGINKPHSTFYNNWQARLVNDNKWHQLNEIQD